MKKLWQKIRSIKNIEVYAAVALCAVAVVVVLLSTNSAQQSEERQTFYEYNSQLEYKIGNVISAIEGCGKATVAITYSSGTEKVYAYETTKQTSASGVVTENTELVTIKGEPLVIKELSPNIIGVVVVASGANDPIVRLRINEVVVTLLGVDVGKVQVFTHKN